MTEFIKFPKIPRLNRDIVITEKLDGTNAQIYIELRSNVPKEVLDDPNETFFSITHEGEDYCMWVGSRSRWIKKGEDNFGFAAWCDANRDELIKLGPGSHFGEWWGKGIQRGYGMDGRVFSLFNSTRWADPATRPACCDVVPVLYSGAFYPGVADDMICTLRDMGSQAAPGFMNPEGVIVYHTAANSYFKVTCKDDEKPKGT